MRMKHLTPALSPLPLQGNAEREKRSQRLGESVLQPKLLYWQRFFELPA